MPFGVAKNSTYLLQAISGDFCAEFVSLQCAPVVQEAVIFVLEAVTLY